MTRTRLFFLTCAYALMHAAPAISQERPDSFRLKEIVATATRTATARDAVPAAVTVLYGEELRARGVRFVAEALRTVPGAAVARTGSIGGLTSLFVRGGESDYVQILLDGIQLNEPGGSFDFGQLTLDNIERIEIVRGPVGMLYGSDAVAGVVQLFTRRGSGSARVIAALNAGRNARVGPQADGSSGTTSWDVSAAGGGQRADFSVGIARYDTDGAYAFNNDYDNFTLTGRGRVALGNRTEATFTSRYTDSEFHFPTDGAGALVDRNQFTSTNSLALGLEAGHAFTPAVEASLALSLHDSDRLNDDRQDGPADTLGSFTSLSQSETQRRSIDIRGNARISASTLLTIGAELERESGSTLFASDGQFGPFESTTDDQRSNSAGYAQVVTTPVPAVTLTVGTRVEDNEQFGGFWTWRVGANYRVGTGTSLRAAGGTGFKEPTFFENFAEGFVRGNPELEPERSRNWELGIEQAFLEGRGLLGATYFNQRFRNLIQFTGQPPQPGAPNYFNVGIATASGAELTASFTYEALEVSGSYTYLDTEVTDEGFGTDQQFLEGRRLLRRPRHSINLGASYTFAGRARIGAAVDHVGERDDLDFSDPIQFAGIRVVLPSYTTVALSGQYDLLARANSRITITASVQNALNEDYEEIRNFPSPGRSVLLGIRAGLGF